MSNTEQKIAEESAQHILKRLKLSKIDHAILKADIQSAIEKATESLQKDLALAQQMVTIESKRANESRAAHASEQGADDFSKLLKIASAMLSSGVFLSTFKEDQDKLKRRDFLDIADKQQERLRLWAIDIAAIVRRQRPTPATPPCERKYENKT